jgi:hypothetical protein
MKSYYSSALLVLVVAAIVTTLVMIDAVPRLALHHIWGDGTGAYAGPSVELSDLRVDTDVGVSLAKGIMFDDIGPQHAAGPDGDHYAFRHEHIGAG